jgi:hypothetical protein
MTGLRILRYSAKRSFASGATSVGLSRVQDTTVKGRDGRLWQPIIGLEVHAQIDSKSKLFSSKVNADSNMVNI